MSERKYSETNTVPSAMRAARIPLVLLLGFFPFSAQAESSADVVASLPPCAVSKPDGTLDEADQMIQLFCPATAVMDPP